MPNPGPNERLSELVMDSARAIHETMWVDPGPWPCDDESHLDGGCTDYVTGQAQAALTAAGVPELLRVVDAAQEFAGSVRTTRGPLGEWGTEISRHKFAALNIALAALEALPTEPPMKGEA